jgi:putative membrane protein
MTTPSSASAPTAWTEGKILQVVHSANDGEIEQAKLARTKASDPRVKQFAAMMIRDHSAADDKTLAVAKQSASSFEPTSVSQSLEADVRGNTSTLSAQTGSEFDREYIETQISEHQAVLATIDNDLMPASQSGDVKNLLTAVRSKTIAHLQQAQDLAVAFQKAALQKK